jgi:hypothetical protein
MRGFVPEIVETQAKGIHDIGNSYPTDSGMLDLAAVACCVDMEVCHHRSSEIGSVWVMARSVSVHHDRSRETVTSTIRDHTPYLARCPPPADDAQDDPRRRFG